MPVPGDSRAVRPGGRWLLLIHHLPPKPDYLRVKVRRQLSRIGAVALKNSVYVLPHTDQALEDLEWLRRMIVDEGGEATVCAASLVDGLDDAEVEAMFRAQADVEYGRILEAVATAGRAPSSADLRRLRRTLVEAEGRDFFHASRGDRARRAVAGAEGATSGGRARAAPRAARSPAARAPRGATWVTRAGVQVDRIASAWLIRRFVDPEAAFKFVPATGYRPAPGEVRFDMFEGEFTHEGDRCTFEVLAERFAPDDPALRAIGEIVHDVDIRDDKFGREEADGVAAIVRRIAAAHDDDSARLQAGAAFLDGLYAALRP